MTVESKDLIKFAQYVAPVFTPRDAAGNVNYDIIHLYVDFLINNGVQGILVGGSCGSGILQSVEERISVAKAFLCAVRRRVVVIVHTGGVNLQDTLHLTDEVSKLDVDAIMLSCPIHFPYSTFNGMVDFLIQAGKACNGKPVMYYHFPILTNLKYDVTNLMETLCDRIPNFIGLKFTSGNEDDYKKLVELKVKIFLGFPNMMVIGAATEGSAVSFITGPTNYINNAMMKTVNLFLENKQDEARELQKEVNGFQEAAVIPGELMASMRNTMGFVGLPMGPPIKPLSELTEQQKEQQKENLAQQKPQGGKYVDMLDKAVHL